MRKEEEKEEFYDNLQDVKELYRLYYRGYFDPQIMLKRIEQNLEYMIYVIKGLEKENN